jgi:hypothetical protein
MVSRVSRASRVSRVSRLSRVSRVSRFSRFSRASAVSRNSRNSRITRAELGGIRTFPGTPCDLFACSCVRVLSERYTSGVKMLYSSAADMLACG